MRWVRNNIGSFGGNPHNVTLFGESAGGVSVGLHLLSDFSKHKFQQAILQSGCPLNPWAVSSFQESRNRSLVLAEKVGCTQSSSDLRLKCLKNLTADEIWSKQDIFSGFLQFPFIPTVDGKFLTDSPENLLSSGNFSSKPIIAGSNKDEATFFLYFAIMNHITALATDAGYQQVMAMLYQYYPRFPGYLTPGDFVKIWNKYPFIGQSPQNKNEKNPIKKPKVGNPLVNFGQLNHATTDSGFVCPMNRFLSLYANGSDEKMFSYLFTQTLDSTIIPPLLGATHASELFFTFGSILKYGKYGNFTVKDIALSKVRTVGVIINK